MTPPRIFSSHRNSFILVSMVLFTMLAFGCQTTRPDNSKSTVQLSTEIEEAHQKIEEIYHRVSVIQFMVDNHQRTITDLEKNLRNSGFVMNTEGKSSSAMGYPPEISGMTDSKNEKALLTPKPRPFEPSSIKEETLAPPMTKQTPEALYDQGFSALKSKNYTQAMSLFQTVSSTFPDHSLANNAMYWSGEIYYTQNEYTEAIQTFKRLIEIYPEGSKVPDALLKIGYAYYSMNDKDNAVRYLKKVVVDYPFTVPGGKAEAMLNRIE